MWDFDLTLLHVSDNFKVEFELFLTVDRLLEAHLGVFELLHNVLLLTLEEHDEVSERAESLLIICLECLHFNSDLSLVDNALELFRINFSKHVAITLEVVHFLLFHLAHLLLDLISVDLVIWVKVDNMTLHLKLLLRRYHNSAVLLACLDEADNLARVQVLVHANCLQSGLLLGEALVVLDHLVKLSVLIVADMHEVFLGLEDFLLIEELVVIFDHIRSSLLHVMKGDRQTDDLELLLLNTSVIEYTLLVKRVELLLELGLNLDDLIADTLQIDEPLLSLLLN